MPTYELGRPLSNFDDVVTAFREKLGEKYTYTIKKRRGATSRLSKMLGAGYDSIVIKKNAYHGVEIFYQSMEHKQYLVSATVTPNAFLASLLGRVGLLDLLIARAVFGTKKGLVEDVNNVVTSAFEVTILDTGISGKTGNVFAKKD